MRSPKRNVPTATPVLLTVIIQWKELPNVTLLLTLFVFVTIRSASERNTVKISVFDVTPLIVAIAVFVTEAAVKSASVTV